MSSPESSNSSSSQDSATDCFFLKAEEDFEGVGCRESFVREDSSSVFKSATSSTHQWGVYGAEADLWVLLPLWLYILLVYLEGLFSGGEF